MFSFMKSIKIEKYKTHQRSGETASDVNPRLKVEEDDFTRVFNALYRLNFFFLFK